MLANSIQKQEYDAMAASGVLYKEKNPGTGAALGILPGGGSFYAGEIGLGVVNLLLWPVSILWDPISGYEGSKADNYYITTQKLKKDKAVEITRIDDQLAIKAISTEEYIRQKNQINEKYNF